MLRITRVDDPARLLLRLEGRLVGEWVGVLESELSRLGDQGSGLVLDLSGVEFATDAGVRVLLDAAERGARFEACSPLIASLLGERVA